MAQLTDKFYNRVIEGDLELSSADKSKNGITKVVANPTLAGTEVGLEGLEVSGTKYSVKKGAVAGVEGAPSGTLATVLGLDNNGKLAKGSVSGGTKLYQHYLVVETSTERFEFCIINNKSSQMSDIDETVGASGCVAISYETLGDAWESLPTTMLAELHEILQVHLSNGSVYDSEGNITSITDTVTPL